VGADLSLSRQKRVEKGRAAPRAKIEVESWTGVDRSLFERLRAMRLEIARARGVPPYVIFHDSTLRELARVKPKSVSQLEGIYGMGARKIEALGGVVLQTINAGE
jgi:ATP-dependent DNA helicase RecQ